jgi:hypothetical protein
MAVADRQGRARGSFERRMWGDAFDQMSAAHREGHLDAEDLERLVEQAWLRGVLDVIGREHLYPTVAAPDGDLDGREILCGWIHADRVAEVRQGWLSVLPAGPSHDE